MDAKQSPRQALESIVSEFHLVLGNLQQVEDACSVLRQHLPTWPDEVWVQQCHAQLLQLLADKGGERAQVVFALLEEQARTLPVSSDLVCGLLRARDDRLRWRAAQLALDLIETRSAPLPDHLLVALAHAIESPPLPMSESKLLSRMASVLRDVTAAGAAEKPDALLETTCLQHPDPVARRFAARLLDADEHLPSKSFTESALGIDVANSLAPYLGYTRATHRDLVDLTPIPGSPPPVLDSLLEAQGLVGEELVRMIVGELGWSRVARGITVSHLVGLSLEGSFPFVVTPPEATILDVAGKAQQVWERFLVITHGAAPESQEKATTGTAVQRFRSYNLAHAEVLTELLEVAPLTLARTRRILEQMDRIVDDFVLLFADQSDEGCRVQQVYETLRNRIAAHLPTRSNDPLSAEVTRLMLMFEDPQNLEDVRTLHGFKRYLHQLGLRQAFRTFHSVNIANRTIDLVLASSERVLKVFHPIQYLDFDPEDSDTCEPPFPVRLATHAFASQLLHGLDSLPHLEILVYGNEVQMFANFRNHPAFLRLDLSPPQRGGMIDLQYFGVSQYEMEHHPDITLQGIRTIFRRLDFDVAMDGFRLQVRYDKERATTLGELISKLTAMLCLLPYLMDVDWVIGSLDYPETIRGIIADAWAEFFLGWAVLPMHKFLTADHRSILLAHKTGPGCASEIAWDGRGHYQDLYTNRPSADLVTRFWQAIEKKELSSLLRPRRMAGVGLSQSCLDSRILEPVRAAVARGELPSATADLEIAPPQLFEREHEAERLARLLIEGGDALREAVCLATMIPSIERHLHFHLTGHIQGHPVECAELPLCGETLHLTVLRDVEGIATCAFATVDAVLYRSRTCDTDPWRTSPSIHFRELMMKLRRNNYLATGYRPNEEWTDRDAAEIAARFCMPHPSAPLRSEPGDRAIHGIAASPGTASGFAILGTTGQQPEAFDGAILVAPVIRPEQAPLLRRVKAIVSTGGGILSHVGLLALELQKPALIIPGTWQPDKSGTLHLVCQRPTFLQEEQVIGPYTVVCRRNVDALEDHVMQGDLITVDADAASLTILGHDRDALALHRELLQLNDATSLLGSASDSTEILHLRGRALRSVHQLEKLLGRLDRPDLARHAVRELLQPHGEVEVTAEFSARGLLLQTLFQNPSCGGAAFAAARLRASEVSKRYAAASEDASSVLPQLNHLVEILYLRLGVIRARTLFSDITSLLTGTGLAASTPPSASDVDALTRARLEERRLELLCSTTGNRKELHSLRFHLRELMQIDQVLGLVETDNAQSVALLQSALEAAQEASSVRLTDARILHPEDGGYELNSMIGQKAASLGEIARILGAHYVPSWFVVSNRAFRETLEVAVAPAVLEHLNLNLQRGVNLAQAIREILNHTESEPGYRASAVRHLWESLRLPADLKHELVTAYRALIAESSDGVDDGAPPSLAIRSSAFEEDTERAAWAGQFDTFLFIQGEEAFLSHLKLAWAGLWTERAIQQREILQTPLEETGGGVIVQRMVNSRVSGVLQTTCIATGQLNEIAINVGLGLGEGIVSGTVNVDQIFVSKGTTSDLQYRLRYNLNDKSERVVFNTRSGYGTRIEETPYHQRLRAALEYLEICELVRVALALEEAYGYPLDIEFAFDNKHLYVLQARPVAIYHAALLDTLTKHPLGKREELEQRQATHDPSE